MKVVQRFLALRDMDLSFNFGGFYENISCQTATGRAHVAVFLSASRGGKMRLILLPHPLDGIGMNRSDI